MDAIRGACVALALLAGSCSAAGNATLDALLDPASRQLLDFKLEHPRPIGVWTTSHGKPVDVRETVGLNSDVFNNALFYDFETSIDRKNIPERVVHTKGAGAFGYFEVTDDVSHYTSAEVFNGIGKKTPVAARFSVVVQNRGGNDLARETRGMSLKFYTNEGNLDLLNLGFPVYFYRDPSIFGFVANHFKRNPKTHLFDETMRLEILNLIPDSIHNALWIFSDYCQSNGYRKFDSFPIHTYEVTNKHGESHFIKFNFRSEQGTEYLTETAARTLGALDSDYSVRDLYNAIAKGDFPSWRLEIDVIPKKDLKKLNYNPFDVTRIWERGTYHTVKVGRLILNRNPDNFFKDVEQAAYNPGNLVPGIPGPPDDMFKARRLQYRDTQNYRVGVNHNNIEVNRPKYRKVYNRDGVPPVLDNMEGAPNYYQNSFNGPVPFVDTTRPKEVLKIYDRNAVDLQPAADFYNQYVVTEGGRTRMAVNIATVLVNGVSHVKNTSLKILNWVDRDLGRRVSVALAAALAARAARGTQPPLVPVDYCPRVLDAVPVPAPTPVPAPVPARGTDACPNVNDNEKKENVEAKTDEQ